MAGSGAGRRGLIVIIHPWESCVGCGACEVVCPEVFSVDDSRGLARVNADYVDSEPFKGSIPGELSDCAERAAEACPVNIIRLGSGS